MKRNEATLLKERRQLASWYTMTHRVKLKMAIRQEIANIDQELRKLCKNRLKSSSQKIELSKGVDKF